MLLSPNHSGDGITMMASGSVRLRAAPGVPVSIPGLGVHNVGGLPSGGPLSGGSLGSIGAPLDACRAVASFVSPLRLHAPLYDRLHHALPGLPPIDPALLTAAHQVSQLTRHIRNI